MRAPRRDFFSSEACCHLSLPLRLHLVVPSNPIIMPVLWEMAGKMENLPGRVLNLS